MELESQRTGIPQVGCPHAVNSMVGPRAHKLMGLGHDPARFLIFDVANEVYEVDILFELRSTTSKQIKGPCISASDILVNGLEVRLLVVGGSHTPGRLQKSFEVVSPVVGSLKGRLGHFLSSHRGDPWPRIVELV